MVPFFERENLKHRFLLQRTGGGIMTIKLKRAYDPVSASDGARILVDRLWPRGMKKEALHLSLWLKEAGPSNDLRKWFSHEVEKWGQFQERYFQELNAHKAELLPLIQAVQKGDVTLVYGAKDTEHNNAVCLRKYLERISKK